MNSDRSSTTPRRAEPAVIITGPEPLLVRRAAEQALAAMLGEDRQLVTVSCGRRSDTGESSAEVIARSAAPSLFGDVPVLQVLDLQDGDDAVVNVVKDLIGDPQGAPVVITHNGSAKGRGVLNAAAKAGIEVVKVTRPNDRDIRRLLRDETRAAGGRMSEPAEQWLVDALGTDSLDLLFAAARQAVADSPDGRVDEAAIMAMIPQQAKVSSFKIVDHVWAGRTDDALRLVRAMEQRERGVGVAVVAAIAHGLRMMATAGMRGSRPGPELGIAPWQVDRARDNARRWQASGARIAGVATRLPGWDADMKGGLDGGVALDDEQKMAALELIVAALSSRPAAP